MRVKRLFRSPSFFRRNRPKIPCTWPDNPTRPASFLRQFSPQHSPPPAPFGAKKRAFCAPSARQFRLLPARMPRCRPFFARPRPLPPAVRRPNARWLPRPPPKPTRCAPPERPLPPPVARRSPRRPRQGTPLGLSNPTAVVGFPASPWRSVRPKGRIRSLGMTGKRPPPPLA